MQYQSPLFLPKSLWQAPTHYPDLSGAKEICPDVETYDPNLDSRGPGGVRNDGFLVGVGIAVDGWSGYYPLRHAEGNVPYEPTIRWLKDTLKNPAQPKVSQKGIYDKEWLWWAGVDSPGTWYDIAIAEALIDEELGSYNLDAMSERYLGETKDETLLREAAAAYGIPDPKKAMHLFPACYVGPYGTGDVDKTLRIYHKQAPVLKEQGLMGIYTLESELTEVLFHMRLQGVKIDPEKANNLAVRYRRLEEKIYDDAKAKFFPKTKVSFASSQDLERVCLMHGFHYLKIVKTGNPSFTKDFFGLEANLDNDFFKVVARWRKVNKLRKDFLEGMCDMAVNGRIYAEFVQMKREDGGTRSGRFSCKNPNLQQIPSRDKEFAPEIRACYLPNEGEEWAKLDYSQQEYRILVHYSGLQKLPGADEATQFYTDDRNADYHQIVANLTGLGRTDAKNVNFAMAYGAGLKKFAAMVGISISAAETIWDTYHANVPYVKGLSKVCENRAQRRGWIKTLGGRVLHFNFWEPVHKRKKGEDEMEMEYEKYCRPERLKRAQGKWPNVPLKRARCHISMNRLIQGGAADMTKIAMVLIYKTLGKVPLMQVHDELSYSVKTRAEAEAIKKIMEECVPLRVPVVADLGVGKSWGETKK